MADQKKNKNNPTGFNVTFVGLKDKEQAPRFAAYKLNTAGRPIRKLGSYDGKKLKIDAGDTSAIALGPDVEDFEALPKESLVNYWVEQSIDHWHERGIVLSRNIWDRFHLHYTCVSGTVNKCRPWFWNLIDNIQLKPMFELAQVERFKPITADLQPYKYFPLNCQPLCDGIVEIYERRCCFTYIPIPDILDRLRDILEILPLPIPDPIPDPFPGPGPSPFSPELLRSKARKIKQRKTAVDLAQVPPENLYQDYMTLHRMPVDTARKYVLERPYLFPIFCESPPRKVGQTPIQPGGQFNFCYLHAHRHSPHTHCYTTYAYKVKQLINGTMTVVYDGLAANQYFSADTSANIRSFNPQALACADGPGDPPPNDGAPFVMLEHVGSYGTFHFNFPEQTGVSEVGSLDLNDGTYTTSYAPDCPWGGALGLRLWFSPELESIVKYYRLKVTEVNDSGEPVGTPKVLDDTVSWDKLIDFDGDIIRAPETLGPMTVGDKNDLFKVPYWSSPDHRYLSGQFHQVWDTAKSPFSDGKYMLILEVFDDAGNRIKPNGADGPGAEKNFQFRRWTSSSETDPVLYADAAHVFWIDNTPVGGDIVDLRQSGIPNPGECQFMTGTASSTLAIGFRAYHINGVEHAGNGDDNSFMWRYRITWQRGLNGDTGTLGPAPSGGTNHTDVGETGEAVSSGSETFENLLGEHSKCTFSVTLRVFAKHFTGSHRISSYDYHENASFALEIS